MLENPVKRGRSFDLFLGDRVAELERSARPVTRRALARALQAVSTRGLNRMEALGLVDDYCTRKGLGRAAGTEPDTPPRVPPLLAGLLSALLALGLATLLLLVAAR